MNLLYRRRLSPFVLLGAVLSAVILLAAVLLPALPAAAAGSTIRLSAENIVVNSTLQVDYQTDRRHAKNWIGIYRAGDGTPKGNPASRAFEYAPEVSGNVKLTLNDGTFAPGDYLVYFLAEDGYEQLTAPLALKVTAEPGTLQARTAAYTGPGGRIGESYSVAISSLFRSTGSVTARYSVVSGPSWATLDGRTLSGTPDLAGEATFVLCAEWEGQSATTTLTAPIVASDKPRVENLSVVTYNAWLRGTQVPAGRSKELDAFITQNADIVMLQESSVTHAAEIAEELGWESYSNGGDSAVISRYPLAESRKSSAAGGVRVVLDEAFDRSVWVWSAHLGYLRYGPYYAQEGKTVEFIMAEENVERGPQARANLADIEQLSAAWPDVPVLYGGDLNTPSHLDWTEATAPKNGNLLVPWPVSTAIHAAGFRDTYREIHPDPVKDPANSWTPRFDDEVQDRIDFIYSRGEALRTVDAEYFHGPSMADWASDHGAFRTDFSWVSETTPEPSPEPDPDPKPSPEPDPDPEPTTPPAIIDPDTDPDSGADTPPVQAAPQPPLARTGADGIAQTALIGGLLTAGGALLTLWYTVRRARYRSQFLSTNPHS